MLSKESRVFSSVSPYTLLLLVLGLLLIIGFATTSLASYVASRDAIRQDIINTELPLTSDNVYSAIQRDLIRPVIISSMMANDTFLRDWVIGGEQNIDRMTRYLDEIQIDYHAVTAYFVSDGTDVYYQTKGVLKHVSPSVAHDQWYFRVRSSNQPYVVEVDTDEANQGRLTVFIDGRVLDYHGKFIGVAGVGLGVNTIVSMIDRYKDLYDRDVYFANEAGVVVLSGSNGTRNRITSANALEKNIELSKLLQHLPNPRGGNFEYRALGQRHFMNVRYIPELKWYLIVDKSETGPLEGVRRALYVNILICVVTSIVILSLVILAIGKYRKQLRDAENKRYEILCSLYHDIRSPHSSILALIETEAMQEKSRHLPEIFNRIEKYTRRALDMVDAFVQLARAETQEYNMQLASVAELLTDASDEVWPQANRKNIKVSILSPTEECEAYMDRDLMTRVFVNILGNSVKYSPDNTFVECRIERYQGRGNRIRCLIRDQGYGIAPEQQQQIFERFKRSRSANQPYADGVGLGLAFVRTVVRGHKGEVTVESSVGGGTIFTIDLPSI
jgi:signal transduction histidine kinase